MPVSQNPKYRNTRDLFYTDKHPDSQGIGTIIQVLKSVEGSYDHSYVPTLDGGQAGTTKYEETTGDAEPEDNPEYQYPGFIYCDGSEYYIKDYPALYEAIGNDYGGTASDGIDIISGGSGWGSTVTVSISAPPSGSNQIFEDIDPVQATATATVVSGVVTGVEVTNPGKGYDAENPPTVSFSSTTTGTTVTYAIRINPEVGQIQSISSSNVWEFWPDPYMGTFKVPDLIAKRIVGNGPVYGSNTPNVGNSELGVGIETIDGNWYMDKTTQKGQFALGNITTTNYSDVSESVEASIIGTQVISVTLQEKKLPGMPQHSHFLLHSEAPQDTNMPQNVSGDRYVISYKASTGKVNNYLPPGGIAKNHTHVLSKGPVLDPSVGTYDIFNWSAGDENSGSIKEEGFYYASGGASSGSYVQESTYGTPTMKKFGSTSTIGGRTVTTNGVPTYETTATTYSTPGSYTPSVPSDVDLLKVTLIGAGGSGGVYTTAGNAGGDTTLSIGTSGAILTAVAEGGAGGGAATSTAGGEGGANGTESKSGTASDDVTVISSGSSVSTASGDGGDGPYWNVTLLAGGGSSSDVPTGAEGTAGKTPLGFNGTNGKSVKVTSFVDVTYEFPYSASTTDESWTLQASNANYAVAAVYFELAGGAGRNCGNYGGNGCGTAGTGGNGKYMKVKLKTPYTNGTVYKMQPGQRGRNWNGQAAAAHNGKGGRAGEGHESNNGGGGGAASVIRLESGNVIIAGAGGGGGGGAFGEGVCGQNARNAGSPGDSVIEDNVALESGTGQSGGRYGCTGGGGGGGGGGVGRSTDPAPGGDPGGGGGGDGGHENGLGGRRGLSAIHTDYIDSVISQTNTSTSEGYVNSIVSEDRGYWTSGAGGGGCGGYYVFDLAGSNLTGLSSISLTVGEGGAGVTNSSTNSSAGVDGYAKIEWKTITGYTGGTTSTTTGDVFYKGSGDQDNGVNFYSSGTGSGTSGGFKLPTTQVPTVTFEGGGGGTGATATATVSGNKISSLSLTNVGSGYTEAPRVRILHGAGVRNYATVGFNKDTGELEGLTLQSSDEPTTYLKFGGTQNDRFVNLFSIDAEKFQRMYVKVARGNGKNGGDLPENGGDELLVYYNTDESDNFPSSGFIGTLVPIPSSSEISSDYDGDGTGDNATNWYTYSIDIPEDAQTATTRFSIRQNRGAASSANDNAANSDHYGIIEVSFENKLSTELKFVASEGKMAVSNDTQTYSVEGSVNASYVSGIFANDLTLTLSSANPIIPTAAIDPDQVIPLIEPYMLVKYLIKAF